MRVRIGPYVRTPLLTLTETAELLGTSRWNVGDLIRRGRFPVPEALLTTGTNPTRTRVSTVALAQGMGWPYSLLTADETGGVGMTGTGTLSRSPAE